MASKLIEINNSTDSIHQLDDDYSHTDFDVSNNLIKYEILD